MNNIIAQIQAFLTGHHTGANTEQQTLNLVLGCSVLFVFSGVGLNLFLGLVEPNYVLIPALVILSITFYRSRFKKLYNWSWLPLAALGYSGLIATYFLNDGSKGPVLLVSIPILISIIAIVKPKVYPVIILLHLILFTGLGALESTNPEAIVETYLSDDERIIDNTFSYMISILFFSVLLGFIRFKVKKQENELDKQREQLEMQNKQLKSIFSVLSHDLRAPLGNVKGYLGVMHKLDLKDAERLNLEKDLLDSTAAAMSILEDVLIWSRAELQGSESGRADVDVEIMLRRAAKDVEFFAEKKNVKISIEAKDLKLNCNKEQMSIVLRNLLHNAIKYSPRGATIKMLAEQYNQNQTTIQVIDYGVGMSSADLEKLFDRVASGRSGTEGEKGAGIGLLLTEQLVKQNGGQIKVSSQQGKGSTFAVTFS